MNKENISMTNNSCKREKDDIISVESKTLTRTAKSGINEKIAIDTKIKACNNEPIQMKMEEGTHLRVSFSALLFEEVKGILEKTLVTNFKTYQKSR